MCRGREDLESNVVYSSTVKGLWGWVNSDLWGKKGGGEKDEGRERIKEYRQILKYTANPRSLLRLCPGLGPRVGSVAGWSCRDKNNCSVGPSCPHVQKSANTLRDQWVGGVASEV